MLIENFEISSEKQFGKTDRGYRAGESVGGNTPPSPLFFGKWLLN